MYLYDNNYLFSHLLFCGHDVWAYLIFRTVFIADYPTDISFSWVLKNQLSISYFTRLC